MQFYTAADSIASGKVQLSALFATVTKAREIVLSCSGTGPIRFGDVNVSATQGLQIPQGVAPTVLRTTVADITDWFDLTECYINVLAGTTASVIVGK